jgi:hypothetical protein
MVQEGRISNHIRMKLAAGLQEIGREMFGESEEVEINWITIKAGYGFTAAKPSTSSLVARAVPFGLPEEQRKAFLSRVCDMWAETTGCTIDEIVVTATDGPAPAA